MLFIFKLLITLELLAWTKNSNSVPTQLLTSQFEFFIFIADIFELYPCDSSQLLPFSSLKLISNCWLFFELNFTPSIFISFSSWNICFIPFVPSLLSIYILPFLAIIFIAFFNTIVFFNKKLPSSIIILYPLLNAFKKASSLYVANCV